MGAWSSKVALEQARRTRSDRIGSIALSFGLHRASADRPMNRVVRLNEHLCAGFGRGRPAAGDEADNRKRTVFTEELDCPREKRPGIGWIRHKAPALEVATGGYRLTGIRRMRLPVAKNTAFAIAGATAMMGVSPPPALSRSGRFNR